SAARADTVSAAPERELAGNAAARQSTIDLLDGKSGLVELNKGAHILGRQPRRQRNMRRFHDDPSADLAQQSSLERLGRPNCGSTLRRTPGGGGNDDWQIDFAELDLAIRAHRLQADLEATDDFGARSLADNVAQLDGPARIGKLSRQT